MSEQTCLPDPRGRCTDPVPRVASGELTAADSEWLAAYDVFLAEPSLQGASDHGQVTVERAELPVIAAVKGLAFGGGTELTLACDLVLASERATFSFKEATVGLIPGYGVVRGPAVIGRHWTRWLALTADVIDAAQALEIGLVQKVVPHDRLLEEAVAVADRIAEHPPLAVRLGKQFVNRVIAEGLAESIETTALLFTTDDDAEGVAAFVEKRPPVFGGA